MLRQALQTKHRLAGAYGEEDYKRDSRNFENRILLVKMSLPMWFKPAE